MNDSSRSFHELSQAEWATWLSQLISGEPVQPKLQRTPRRDLDQDLMSLFHQLTPVAAERFRNAVAEALQGTPHFDQYADRLFVLLQLTIGVKPVGFRAYLERLVRDETLLRLRASNHSLQALALLARARYAFTSAFVEYLLHSVKRIAEFDYTLIVLRVTAAEDPQLPIAVLPQAIEHSAGESSRERQLSRQIAAIFQRHGYAALLRWCATALTKLRHETQNRIMIRVITTATDLLDNAEAPGEGHRAILLHLLAGCGRRLTPTDIVALARLQFHVDADLARTIMEAIWQSQLHLFPDKAPWSYIPYDHPYAERALRAAAAHTDVVFNELGDAALNRDAEPLACALFAAFDEHLRSEPDSQIEVEGQLV